MQVSEWKALAGLHRSTRKETAQKYYLRFPLASTAQRVKMQVSGGNIRCLNSADVSTESIVYSTTVLGIFDYITMLSDGYSSGYLKQPNK